MQAALVASDPANFPESWLDNPRMPNWLEQYRTATSFGFLSPVGLYPSYALSAVDWAMRAGWIPGAGPDYTYLGLAAQATNRQFLYGAIAGSAGSPTFAALAALQSSRAAYYTAQQALAPVRQLYNVARFAAYLSPSPLAGIFRAFSFPFWGAFLQWQGAQAMMPGLQQAMALSPATAAEALQYRGMWPFQVEPLWGQPIPGVPGWGEITGGQFGQSVGEWTVAQLGFWAIRGGAASMFAGEGFWAGAGRTVSRVLGYSLMQPGLDFLLSAFIEQQVAAQAGLQLTPRQQADIQQKYFFGALFFGGGLAYTLAGSRFISPPPLEPALRAAYGNVPVGLNAFGTALTMAGGIAGAFGLGYVGGELAAAYARSVGAPEEAYRRLGTAAGFWGGATVGQLGTEWLISRFGPSSLIGAVSPELSAGLGLAGGLAGIVGSLMPLLESERAAAYLRGFGVPIPDLQRGPWYAPPSPTERYNVGAFTLAQITPEAIAAIVRAGPPPIPSGPLMGNPPWGRYGGTPAAYFPELGIYQGAVQALVSEQRTLDLQQAYELGMLRMAEGNLYVALGTGQAGGPRGNLPYSRLWSAYSAAVADWLAAREQYRAGNINYRAYRDTVLRMIALGEVAEPSRVAAQFRYGGRFGAVYSAVMGLNINTIFQGQTARYTDPYTGATVTVDVGTGEVLGQTGPVHGWDWRNQFVGSLTLGEWGAYEAYVTAGGRVSQPLASQNQRALITELMMNGYSYEEALAIANATEPSVTPYVPQRRPGESYQGAWYFDKGVPGILGTIASLRAGQPASWGLLTPPGSAGPPVYGWRPAVPGLTWQQIAQRLQAGGYPGAVYLGPGGVVYTGVGAAQMGTQLYAGIHTPQAMYAALSAASRLGGGGEPWVPASPHIGSIVYVGGVPYRWTGSAWARLSSLSGTTPSTPEPMYPLPTPGAPGPGAAQGGAPTKAVKQWNAATKSWTTATLVWVDDHWEKVNDPGSPDDDGYVARSPLVSREFTQVIPLFGASAQEQMMRAVLRAVDRALQRGVEVGLLLPSPQQWSPATSRSVVKMIEGDLAARIYDSLSR